MWSTRADEDMATVQHRTWVTATAAQLGWMPEATRRTDFLPGVPTQCCPDSQWPGPQAPVMVSLLT